MSVNLVTRVQRAEQSSDLSEHKHDIQLVRAAGVASVRKRLGSLLPRFLASGGHEGRIGLLDLLTAVVRRNYPAFTEVERRGVATGALYLYLVPRCAACKGRAFELLKDTPTLSDKPCAECKGTGRNELHVRDEKIAQALTWAGNELARAEQEYSAAVGRKLGRD